MKAHYGQAAGVAGGPRLPFAKLLVEKYVNALSKFKYPIVLIWIVVAIGCAFFILRFIHHTTQSFHPHGSTQSSNAFHAMQEAFPNKALTSDYNLYLRLDDDGENTNILSKIDYIFKFTSAVDGGLINAFGTELVSFFSYTVLANITKATAIADRMISPNGLAMAVPIVLKGNFASKAAGKQGKKLVSVVEQYEHLLDGSGVSCVVNGMPLFMTTIISNVQKDMERMDGIVIPLALIVMAFTVGSVRLVMMPIITVGLTISLSFAIMYGVVQAGMIVSVTTPSMMMSLIVAMAIDYNLFILSRYVEELRRGVTGPTVIKIVLRTAGHTVLISGLTLMISFLALVFFPLDMIKSFGVGCCIAIFVALLVSLSFTPCLLLSFPNFFENSAKPLVAPSWMPLRMAKILRLKIPKARLLEEGGGACDGAGGDRNHDVGGGYGGTVEDTQRSALNAALFDSDDNKDDDEESEIAAAAAVEDGSTFLVPTRTGTRIQASTRSSAATNNSLDRSNDNDVDEAPTEKKSQEGKPRKGKGDRKGDDDPLLPPSSSVAIMTTAEGSTAGGWVSPVDPLTEAEGSFFYRFRRVLEFPYSVIVLTLILGVAVGIGTQTLHFKTTDNFSAYLPRGTNVRKNFEAFVADFGYSYMFPYKFVFKGASQNSNDDRTYFQQEQQQARQGMMRSDHSNINNSSSSSSSSSSSLSSSGRSGDGVVTSSTYTVTSKAGFEFVQGYLKAVVAASEQGRLPFASIDMFMGLVAYKGQWTNYEDLRNCLAALTCPDKNMLAFLVGTVNNDRSAMFMTAFLDVDPMGPEGDPFYRGVLRVKDEYVAAMRESDDPAMREVAQQITIYVEGLGPTSMDSIDLVYHLFPIIITASCIAVLVITGLSFRSLLIPLRSVLSIAITEGFVFGLAVLTYQTGIFNWTHWVVLQSQDGITWTAPIVAFSIIIGVALDYDIFLLTRIMEYVSEEGLSTRDSILCGLCSTGKIITAAGVIMSVAFFGLMISSVKVLNVLGFFMVTAVLFDTFIVRTLFVPSLMALLGKWNWWPRKLELHPFSSSSSTTLNQQQQQQPDQDVDEDDGSEGQQIAAPSSSRKRKESTPRRNGSSPSSAKEVVGGGGSKVTQRGFSNNLL